MAQPINTKDVATLYGVGIIAGGTLGYVVHEVAAWSGIYFNTWESVTFGAALLIGTTSAGYYARGMKQLLRIKDTPLVTAAAPPGRAIPINFGGSRGTVHTFLSHLSPLRPGRGDDLPPPPAPDRWTISNVIAPGSSTPVNVQLTVDDVTSFLRVAWSRQRGSKSPFSRRYWTTHRRPPLDRDVYYGLLTLLQETGLIINRRTGKSGRLLYPPELALNYLKSHYLAG